MLGLGDRCRSSRPRVVPSPARAQQLKTVTSRLGDFASGILQLLCTKDDKGYIMPGLVLRLDAFAYTI
jgi:hypothetical protein